jgi:hypothetical protein
MAWVENAINNYVKRKIMRQLHSSYVQYKAILFFMAGGRVVNLDKLGDPKAPVIIGGASMGQAEMMRLNGSYNHQFRYQTAQTDAPAVVTASSTPAATGFADDNVGQAETRWSHFSNALKVRQSRVDAAKGDLEIASIIDEAMGMGWQRALEKHQTMLWTGTLTSNQQDAEDWISNIGLKHWVSDGVDASGSSSGGDVLGSDESDYATVARVDRTTHTQLKATVLHANRLVANGVLADTKPRLALFRKVRITNSLGGVANKRADAGRCVITGPDLFNVLADEAEGKYQIHQTSIPGFAIGGFKFPVIQYGNILITYDPDCPEGEWYQLTPESFLFEIQAGSNFVVEPWTKEWLVKEGGGYYQRTQIRAKTRFTCREPWLQVKGVGFTVDGD